MAVAADGQPTYANATVVTDDSDEARTAFPEIDEAVRRFGPGDCLVAYTDGAIEARSPDGDMFGVEGLRDVFRSGWADTDGRWPAAMVRAVERYRKGEADDDTLVVELFRTLGGGTIASPDG